MAVEQDVPVVAHNTDVHTAGVQVDATVKGVLGGVEAHEVSSSLVSSFFPKASILLGYAEGEASIIIKRSQRMGGTEQLCSPVVQAEVSGNSAPAAEPQIVEVLDRPIFLRRRQRDRDWDQILGVSGAAFDSYQLSSVLDSRAGNNTLNHDDKQVDALIDRMKEAPTGAALLQAGYDFQRYVTGSMMTCGIASLPFLQAARTDVKGYVYLHGYKVRFDMTWLDKP
jgi:hypothetical protein